MEKVGCGHLCFAKDWTGLADGRSRETMVHGIIGGYFRICT